MLSLRTVETTFNLFYLSKKDSEESSINNGIFTESFLQRNKLKI